MEAKENNRKDVLMAKRYTPPKNSKRITIDITELEAEKRLLYVSGNNPKRLKEVIKMIQYFNYGIK